MKLINSVGPNPHVVRMFAAERGVDLPTEDIDIMAGANRQDDYLSKNPSGQAPCLELDDGSYIAEITAICEYLDEVSSGTSLIGDTPEARAQTRMWTRRVDLNICEPMANGFRFSEGLALFKDRIVTVPEAAEGLKRIAQDRLNWLDGQLEGRTFLCGERLTLADVLLYCFLAFGASVGQPLNPDNANVKAWFDRMAERPSASA
ncbi:MAG: glutathione S-transferase [Gammaproteobacteria bacterium]|nr:glutathione S-transferase [Gammaproteobacteria bacterium]